MQREQLITVTGPHKEQYSLDQHDTLAEFMLLANEVPDIAVGTQPFSQMRIAGYTEDTAHSASVLSQPHQQHQQQQYQQQSQLQCTFGHAISHSNAASQSQTHYHAHQNVEEQQQYAAGTLSAAYAMPSYVNSQASTTYTHEEALNENNSVPVMTSQHIQQMIMEIFSVNPVDWQNTREYSSWSARHDESIAPREGLSRSAYKKIDTMKMGHSTRTCSICYQEFEKDEIIKRLPCKHIFHSCCIKPWLAKHTQCPNCRFDVEKHFKEPKK